MTDIFAFEQACQIGNLDTLKQVINEIKKKSSSSYELRWNNGIAISLKYGHIPLVCHILEQYMEDIKENVQQEEKKNENKIDIKNKIDTVIKNQHENRYYEFIMNACRSVDVHTIKFALNKFPLSKNQMNYVVWNSMISCVCDNYKNIDKGIKCVKYIIYRRFQGKKKDEIKSEQTTMLSTLKCYCCNSKCIMHYIFKDAKNNYIDTLLDNDLLYKNIINDEENQ